MKHLVVIFVITACVAAPAAAPDNNPYDLSNGQARAAWTKYQRGADLLESEYQTKLNKLKIEAITELNQLAISGTLTRSEIVKLDQAISALKSGTSNVDKSSLAGKWIRVITDEGRVTQEATVMKLTNDGEVNVERGQSNFTTWKLKGSAIVFNGRHAFEYDQPRIFSMTLDGKHHQLIQLAANK